MANDDLVEPTVLPSMMHRRLCARHFECFGALVLLVIGAAGCTRTDTPYREAVRNGSYAFILPPDEASRLGWELQPIVKSDWEAHCLPGPSAPWNPLNISYASGSGQTRLEIRISDTDVIWQRDRAVARVKLGTVWAKENTAVVYEDDEFSPLKFQDRFGNDVVVSGLVSISEKAELIDKLEYVGPPPEEFVNPWSVEWCEDRS